LTPFFGFLLKPPPVIGGRAAGDAAAQVGKPQLQFGVGQHIVNLLVEFVDDRGWRVFGCADTYPCSRIVNWHNLGQGWPIRQDLRGRCFILTRPLASHHSITSSARPDNGSGTVRPSALAVLRFKSSSTFVTCCTGRAIGFSPFRMRPV